MLIGVVVSYVIALPYVAVLKGVYLNAPVPLGVLLSTYCFAFLPLDIVKAILAALLAGRLEKPLGAQLQQSPVSGAYIITADAEFEQNFGKKAARRRKLYNGMIPCQLYMYF